MPKMKSISIDRLREVLTYDPATGIFRWAQCTANRVQVGARARTLNKRGYREIMLDRVRLLEHRIAVAMMTGKWPSTTVDHRDLNRQNNAWGNLRPATASEQQGNSPKRRTNTSGFKGVFLDKRSGKWTARLHTKEGQRHLGCFDTPEEASEAYQKGAEARFGEFARAT